MDVRLWIKAGAAQRGLRIVDIAPKVGISCTDLSKHIHGYGPQKTADEIDEKILQVFGNWDREHKDEATSR